MFYLIFYFVQKLILIDLLFQGRVIIKALPEISTKGLTVDDVDSLLEKTRNIMIDAFNEINREMQSSNNSSSS